MQHKFDDIVEFAQIINVMLIVLSIFRIGYTVHQEINGGKEIADVYLVTPSVLTATFVSGKMDFGHGNIYLK